MNIAIIVALNEESLAIKKELGLKKSIDNFIFPAVIGDFNKNKVLLVRCGPGKVNSSIAALDVIQNFLPNIVISCGLAGATVKKLAKGDVIIAEMVVQHDVIAYTQNQIRPRLLRLYKNKHWSRVDYLTCDSNFVNLSKRILSGSANKYNIYCGIIATGDQLVLSKKYRKLINKNHGALSIDMESAAVGHVCHTLGVKFGCIRVISDTKEIISKKNLTPSLIRDKFKDVKTCSQLCAKVLRNILEK